MLTYSQMVALCKEVKPLIEGKRFVRCSVIGSYHFILEFEGQRLLISLQSPFLRFHLFFKQGHGQEDSFCKKVNAVLHGMRVETVSLLNEDRIFCIEFHGGKKMVAELFLKRPNLYLLDAKNSILASVNAVKVSSYVLPARTAHSLVEVTVSSKEIASLYEQKEEEKRFQDEKKAFEKSFSDLLKRAQKNVEKASADLKRCLDWERVQHEAQLLQTVRHNMKKGMKEIVVQDWANENRECRIQLDPKKTPQDEVTKRFTISKKLRAGIPHQKRMLEKAEKECQVYSKLHEQAVQADSWQSLEELRKHLPTKKVASNTKEAPLPYREFLTAAGLKIWVGKSAANNETLTFSLAHGSDWWLHVRDFPGSHVVLRVGKQQEPDRESIQDAIQLALEYSKAKGDADVCITQRKFVARFGKSKKGQVHLSKHQVVHASQDKARLQQLKERSL